MTMLRRWFLASLAAVFAAVSLGLPSDAEGARLIRGGRSGGGGGGDAYTWYTALDKSTIPSHAGAGAWGSQRAIAEAAAPSVSTSVGVSTCADFKTEMLAGARTITIDADVSCVGSPVISGNVTDVDVIIPPGRILRSFYVGQFGSGHVATRLRFRGNTVGSHSGGQLHHISFFADTADVIFDGIDITGPGVIANASPPPDWIQQHAVILQGTSNSRMAFTNVRGMAGNYFFIGVISDLIVTGSSFFTAEEPRQTSGVEGWVFRVIGPASGGTHVFYGNDFRGRRFHKLRFHPDGSTSYLWIANNYFVDVFEGRLLTANSALVSDPKGYFAGLWAVSNQSWADINLASGDTAGNDFSSGSAAYVRFTDNAFNSDDITSDALTPISDIEGLIPNGSEDWVKSGQTFAAFVSAPAWKTGTPGDPTGLTWDLGE